MNERQFDRVQQLFSDALELPTEQRESWLIEQCGDGSEMLEEVRSLLNHDSPQDDLLEGQLRKVIVDPLGETPFSNPLLDLTFHADSELAVTMAQSSVNLSGSQIGPYKLLQQLGEGGMGVVYMAHQTTPLDRRVAIKIIKPGMDTRHVIARFEAERQTLAMMDHPNIAMVIDAGETDAGRPYFVMELVKGVPITQYCDEHKLSTKERLKLFIPVCQAVQHAHHKGIIHRDLKPSNVLVSRHDDTATPKIIDFGIAKAITTPLTEKSMVTQYGQILGTIEYMSPEQATFNQLDVDTRTDIYSLGVLLYELLTGRTPFDQQQLRGIGLHEVFRILREEEPPKPSVCLSRSELLASVAANRGTDSKRLLPLVRGEMDWVAMKALDKDRARRYETANDLAADVQRFLSDTTVLACPPSAIYRFRKTFRRHRALVASVSCVLIALLLGLFGTSWFAIEATRKSILATDAEQLARERFEEQTEATRRAEDAVQKSVKTLYDLNTSFGLFEADSNRPAGAMLWFAEAAKLAEPGSHEERACGIRHSSWSEYAPTLVNFLEHDGRPLKGMQYDSSGNFLATLTSDGASQVWDTSYVATPIWKQPRIVQQVWHPNQSIIALALEDNRVQIVAIPSGKILQEFDFDEPISSLAYDHQGNRIAIGGKTIRIGIVETGEFQDQDYRQESVVLSLKFSADDSRILAYCDDDYARLFDTESNSNDPLIPPARHYGTGFPGRPITEPIFVDLDRGILTKSGGTVASWTDIETGRLRKKLSFAPPNISCLAASPDRRGFAVTSQSGGFQIWDAIHAEMIAASSTPTSHYFQAAYSPDGLDLIIMKRNRFERIKSSDGESFGAVPHLVDTLQRVCWSPTGRHLSTASFGGRVSIWEIGSFLPHQANQLGWRAPSTANERVRQLSLSGKGARIKRSQSGDYVLACGSNYIFGNLKRATLFSARDGSVVDFIDSDALVLDACISHDDATLAIATLDKEIEIWDRGNGDSRRKLATLDSEPVRIEFGPTSKELIVLEIDGRVTVFDTQSGDQVWSKFHPNVELPPMRRLSTSHMYQQENGFPYMRFEKYDLRRSSNGNWFATSCSNKIVCVWNTDDGSHRLPPIRLANNTVSMTAVSPDDRWLAIGGDRAEVWDLDNATKSADLAYAGRARSAVFDSTAERLAIFNVDGAGSIHDRQSGKRICAEIDGHAGLFLGQNEEWLLTAEITGGTSTGGARLWSTLTGRPVTPLWPLSVSPFCIVPSHDSRNFFISGMAPNTDLVGAIDHLSLLGLIDSDILSTSDRQMHAEIAAGKRVERSKLSKLSAQQWKERVHNSDIQPGQRISSRWEKEEDVAWHRNQQVRAMQDRNPHAAKWHSDRLKQVIDRRQGSTDASALAFDGNTAHVRVPGLRFQGDVPITLECYVTPASIGSSESSVIGNVNFAGIGFGLGRSGCWQAFWAQPSANRRGYEYAYAKSDSTAVAGRRVHVAAVFADSEIALFIDGTRIDSEPTGEHLASAFGFFIGADPQSDDAPEQFFDGTIDEVRISDVARYDNSFVPAAQHVSDANTLLLYHMDEGEGLLTADDSGHERHGWVSGAAWVPVP